MASSVESRGQLLIIRPTVVKRLIHYLLRAATNIVTDVPRIVFPETEMLQNLADHLRNLDHRHSASSGNSLVPGWPIFLTATDKTTGGL
jgi:hypothetical protein